MRGQDRVNMNRRLEAELRLDPDRGGGPAILPAAMPADPPEEWVEIDGANYTATPASTSAIDMSDTSDLAVGTPVRYTYDGDTYYGVVTAIDPDTSITIMGAPLDTGEDLTALEYAGPAHVIQIEFQIAKASFGATAADLLDSIMKTAFRWRLGAAYLVGFSGKLKTANGTTNPKINVTVDGDAVSTNDSNNGIQPTGSWVDNPAVAISAANYGLANLSTVGIKCTVAGGTTGADLTVSCVFVLE